MKRVITQDQEPCNYKEAMISNEADHWQKAMDEKMISQLEKK
jgi:hypothetical protein